ncbi:hypothetical protein BGZ65_004555, partial [Modicella reniformis]
MNGNTGSTGGINSGANGSHGHHTNNSGGNTSPSFLDFAGNSRYQAYNLARFSTFSAAASPSASSPSSFPSAPSKQDSSGASSSNHTDRAHSNPASADSKSPLSSTPLGISSSKQHHDDKDDDWAVNESYSGHSGHGFVTSSSSTSTSTSDSKDSSSVSSISLPTSTTSTIASRDDDSTSHYESSRTALQPSLSSFKSPASIEASWRRTSETLPPATLPPGKSILSTTTSSKAGGLDLSSSTLVQQMLFQERAPHADNSENENSGWIRSDEGYNKLLGVCDTALEDMQWQFNAALLSLQYLLVEKGIALRDQSSTVIPAPTPAARSPSLTTMLLNQSSVNNPIINNVAPSPPAKLKVIKVNNVESSEEDHISKLDIRVGIVRSVAAHPDAESLYIEQVDVGDKENDRPKEPRTIVSGLVRHVPKDYLEGRVVIVVGNMKPSKLRGVVSEGMLLCAMEQDKNGEVIKVGLLEPAEGSQAGDKVITEGYTDE